MLDKMVLVTELIPAIKAATIKQRSPNGGRKVRVEMIRGDRRSWPNQFQSPAQALATQRFVAAERFCKGVTSGIVGSATTFSRDSVSSVLSRNS